MHPVVLVLLSVIMGVIGQLILKTGVNSLGPLALGVGHVPGILWRITTNRQIVFGLALYGVSTFFWLIALSRVELGFAYPFISLSYILILLASWTLFGERLSLVRIVGVAAICLGVYAVAVG